LIVVIFKSAFDHMDDDTGDDMDGTGTLPLLVPVFMAAAAALLLAAAVGELILASSLSM
jgi:hypothetical protein